MYQQFTKEVHRMFADEPESLTTWAKALSDNLGLTEIRIISKKIYHSLQEGPGKEKVVPTELKEPVSILLEKMITSLNQKLQNEEFLTWYEHERRGDKDIAPFFFHDIATCIYAYRGNKDLPKIDIQRLLDQIKGMKLVERELIAHNLFSIDLLVRAGNTTNLVSLSQYYEFMQMALKSQGPTHKLSSILYGLGIIVENQAFAAESSLLPATIFADYLREINGQTKLSLIDCRNFFLAFGHCVAAGLIIEENKSGLAFLIDELYTKTLGDSATIKRQGLLRSHWISDCFFHYKNLFEQGYTTANVRAIEINTILNSLKQSPFLRAMDIASIIFSLSYLSKWSKLEGKIQNKALKNLIDTSFKNKAVRSTNYSRVIYNLGVFYKNNNIDEIPIPWITSILDCVSNFISAQDVHLQSTHGREILIGLGYLQKIFSDDWISSNKEMLKNIAGFTIQNKYFTPSEALSLIYFFPRFVSHAQQFHPLFVALTQFLTPITSFSPGLQKKIEEIQSGLALRPEWLSLLNQALGLIERKRSRVEEVSVSIKKQATGILKLIEALPTIPSNNQIYIYIWQQKYTHLEQFLNVSLTPGNMATVSAPKSASGVIAQNTQYQSHTSSPSKCLSDIKSFLNLPAEQLQTLIKKSNHSYFSLLLYACKRAELYEFVEQNKLNQIILHLPKTELAGFIGFLMSPLTVYVKEKSILAILNALTIRALMQNEHEPIELRAAFLEKALVYHHPNYHQHVHSRLSTIAKIYNERALILIEQEDMLSLKSYLDALSKKAVGENRSGFYYSKKAISANGTVGYLTLSCGS